MSESWPMSHDSWSYPLSAKIIDGGSMLCWVSKKLRCISIGCAMRVRSGAAWNCGQR